MCAMAEHRVSVLSATLRRYEDPERSSDPRIRAIVADLRTVSPAPPMRAHFRAELRAQLVSVAPRLVAEGVGAERPLTHEAKKSASGATRELPVAAGARGAQLGRGGAFALARPAAVAAALGGAVWLSRAAVPGDSLYGLKRANESVQLALTSGDTARGQKYLDFAAERAHEASVLLSRSSALAAGGGTAAGGGINSHTAKLVSSALDSSDNDVRNASRLLGSAAVQSNSPRPLDLLAAWGPQQMQRLTAISDRLPSNSPLASKAAQSSQLVSEAVTRSKTLVTLLDCHCLNNAPSDSLGPLPCIVCAPTATPSVGGILGGGASSDAQPNPQSSTGAGAVSGSGGQTQSSSQSQSSSGSSTSSGGGGGLPLPSLTNGPTIQLPPIIPVPTPSGDASAPCVINAIGICVKI
jgi:hypothetical protein